MTKKRIELALSVFEELDSGRRSGVDMPAEIFNASLKVFPQLAIETVVYRFFGDPNEGIINLQVHLHRRPDDDPNYPGLLHSAGSFMRAGETPDLAATRVMKRELSGTAKLVKMEFAGYGTIHHPTRGYYACLHFACLIDGEPATGDWFPVLDLPKDLVAHHFSLIPARAAPLLRHWAGTETVIS